MSNIFKITLKRSAGPAPKGLEVKVISNCNQRPNFTEIEAAVEKALSLQSGTMRNKLTGGLNDYDVVKL